MDSKIKKRIVDAMNLNKVEEIYLSGDGQIFLRKNHADLHAKEKKQKVRLITKDDLITEPETTNNTVVAENKPAKEQKPPVDK